MVRRASVTTRVFYLLGRVIVGLKIRDQQKTSRSGSFFKDPQLIPCFSACNKGSRYQNTRHATLPSGRRLTAHPWRWEAWLTINCRIHGQDALLLSLIWLLFLQDLNSAFFFVELFLFCVFFISARKHLSTDPTARRFVQY